MLTLVLGRAGAGKTGYVFDRIKEHVEKGEGKTILIVPEQYSHDAEREMAAVCPENASLYAEVLSFSRLASRVFAETGGLAENMLDKGGRVLAMSLAIERVRDYLKIYRLGNRKSEFLTGMINTYDELRSACAQSRELEEASEKSQGNLSSKLSDLALIFDSYETIKETCGLDGRDRLQRLADSIGESSVGCGGNIYIDGFTDFTLQERRIIEELMKKECHITVCLGCDGLETDEQIFSLPASTARSLASVAASRNVHTEILLLDGNRDSTNPMVCLEKNLFNYGAIPFHGESPQIELWRGEDIYEECVFAAYKARELVKSGARYRDIGVVAPDFSKYASLISGIFSRYDVPVNETDKVDIMEKPVISHIISALEIIINNWAYNDVFKYIKTGLAGVSYEECDLLENYVLKWNIRGAARWTGKNPWLMHPGGYSDSMSEKDRETLNTVNCAREKIAFPLEKFTLSLRKAGTAFEKVQAVYDFIEDTDVYQTLEERAAELNRRGELRLYQEYVQLWDILMNGLTQVAEILGESNISNDEFYRLLKLTLSQYEIATIPSSVDGVGVGDMGRMRKRGIKHLIVLGATDTAMPSYTKSRSLLSEEEKVFLRSVGIELPNPEDDTIARELGLIYQSLTLPCESLTVVYPSSGRKSYIVSRIELLFEKKEKIIGNDIYLNAVRPCFELAAGDGESAEVRAAKSFFRESPQWEDRMKSLKLAAEMPRGRLTRITTERLYGKKLNLSPSRIEKFNSCKYAYFLQYGLGLRPRKKASLDALESGTFIHFILERSTREAERRGGFSQLSDEELAGMAKRYADEYAETKLGGLENKTGRFKYLFKRLSEDGKKILISMAEELRGTKFKALDFELKFAPGGDLPPIEIESGTEATSIVGVVDRVDGWVHDGRLYLRVVDYKTGRKSFSLADVYNGMGMQMLIYLFALMREGEERYNMPVEPAGVLYAPARVPIINAKYDLDQQELKKEQVSKLKRSGLLTKDTAVIEAMMGDTEGFLPVKFNKDGSIGGDSLATMEQLGILSDHIDMTVKEMAKELRSGYVSADPYFVASSENACLYCEYFDACHFNDGYGEDKTRYISKLSTPKVWMNMEEERNGRD